MAMQLVESSLTQFPKAPRPSAEAAAGEALAASSASGSSSDAVLSAQEEQVLGESSAASASVTGSATAASAATRGASKRDTEGARRKRLHGKRHAASALLDTLSPVLRTYACGFADVEELHKQQAPTWKLTHAAQLVFTDPPYNLRAVPQDTITVEDMKAAARVMGRTLRPGRHLVLFCAAHQLGAWKVVLEALRQPGSSEPLLMVDGAPLVITWHPNYNTGYCSRSTTALKNCAEFAVHATAAGAGAAGFAAVNYANHGFLQSRFGGTDNVLENVRKAVQSEIIYVPTETKDKRRMLRTQQKPVPLLQELIARFSQPQDMVVDLFSGTLSTAPACAKMPGGAFGRFVGCERDEECVRYSRAWLAQMVAPVVKDGTFDTVLRLSPRAAKRLHGHAEVLSPMRSTRVGVGFGRGHTLVLSDTVPPSRLCWWTAVPRQLQEFLLGMLPPQQAPDGAGAGAHTAGDTYLRGSVGTWKWAQQASLAAIDHTTLRAAQSVGAPVRVADAGYGRWKVLARRPIRVRAEVLPAMGAFVYADLSSKVSESQPCGRGPLMTMPADFRARAVELPALESWWATVRDPDQQILGGGGDWIASSRPMWLVPPPWALRACVRDPRDVLAAAEADAARARARGQPVVPVPSQPPTPNARYKVHGGALHKPTARAAPDEVYLSATREIAAGEEILADRGPQYKPPPIPTPEMEEMAQRKSPFGLTVAVRYGLDDNRSGAQ